MLLEDDVPAREVNSMIKFKQKGDFKKATTFFTNSIKKNYSEILEKYGKLGVEALKKATPVDTGKTSESWYYKVESYASGLRIVWSNSNVNKGVPIAVVIQYGHGTGTGGWVEGRDYINPALQPIFETLAEELWKETTKT